MANLIQHKRSSVAAAVPNSTDLELGELAINTTDKKVYMKDGTNTVIEINNTDNVEEGSNLYYTDARARQSISVVDTAGDGSLSYDNVSGIITYAGISDAQVRVKFSAAGDLAYNPSTGEFSFTERTDNDVRALFSAGGDIGYNNLTGEISFTERTDSEVRNLVSATGDLAYNSTSGQFSYTKQTPAEILIALQTVDGPGSNVDSDQLDSQEGSYYLDYTNFTNTPAPSLQYAIETSAFTAVEGNRYVVDTGGGAFTGLLPASPSVGDAVELVNIGGVWGTNTFTLSGNGNNIDDGGGVGATVNLVDATQTIYSVFFDGTNWYLFQTH